MSLDQSILEALGALDTGLDLQVDALIATGDIKAIYDLAPQFQAASDPVYHAIRAKLRSKLGGDWRPLDKLRRNGPRLVTSSNGHRPDWRAQLLLSEQGKVKPLLANAITALRHAPEWQGVLAYNSFSTATAAVKPTPWGYQGPWRDHEDLQTCDWLQHAGVGVSTEATGQAIQVVAQDTPFHPVRDYLNALEWDGDGRIDSWLSVYLGVPPSNYVAAVGARWLISAVARIFQPGSKADCCLILEGPQGAQKSTALRTLADPWFTDDTADLGSKDAAMATMGIWIIELAELDSMSRGETSKIKAFMSRSVDRFRPPYGKRLIDSPRQCVFAGSTNTALYNRDETGARRLWPVVCNQIDIPSLAAARNQLWAEALIRFREGAIWWLDTDSLTEEASVEQAARYEGDTWDELIEPWLRDPRERFDREGHPIEPPFTSTATSVSMSDILAHCIGKPTYQWTKRDKDAIGRALRTLGWEIYRSGPRGSREYRYRPSSHLKV